MKILKIQTLRGPNYWSIRRHKLIVMRLDLEELADKPSNKISGFYEGLVKVLPSLDDHFCSPGVRGGFLSRVREGTMMGHIIEHVALELQEMTGMRVGFGRTRETATPGIYQVVFEYVDEQAGRYAARAAVRLCQSIVDTGTYPQSELDQDLKDLEELARDGALGPSTEAIVKEAEARGIPWMPLSARAMTAAAKGRRRPAETGAIAAEGPGADALPQRAGMAGRPHRRLHPFGHVLPYARRGGRPCLCHRARRRCRRTDRRGRL